ncbi:MAG: PQQ-binding-like beta-propeller repeat protein [Planctomycetota bacterium]|nr:PQQ-binding-like beta-propeller repeat protein [Planctomycetota bacterium]
MVAGQSPNGLTLAPLPTGLGDQRLPLVDHRDLQLIQTANGMLQQKDIPSALDRMNRLTSQTNGKLVPTTTAGLPLGYRRFIGVESFVHGWHQQVAEQIPLVWKQQQIRFDRFAGQEAMAESAATNEALLRLLERWPYSVRAWHWRVAMGDNCFLAGQFLAARMHWHQVGLMELTSPPATEYAGSAIHRFVEFSEEDQRSVQIREFLAQVVGQQPELAQQTLETLMVHADMELSLGGRRGRLEELLPQFYAQHFPVADAANSTTDFPVTRNPRTIPVETFQRSPSWFLNLASTSDQAFSVDGRLEVMPAVHGSHVYVNTLDAILAIDAVTGKPAWGEESTAYRIYEHGEDAAGESWFDESIPYWGSAQGIVEISGDRLVACVGDPTNTYHQSLQEKYHLRGALVALDLSAEGSLVSGFPVFPDGRSPNAASRWTFVSPPKIVDGRIMILLRESAQFQCRNYLACYSLDSGQEIWRTLLGGSPATGREMVSTLEPARLEVAGDRLIACTNTGQVAAVDLSGRLCWVVTYPTRFQQAELVQLKAPTLRRSRIVIGERDLVATVSPADGLGIMQLDLFSGAINWVVDDPRFDNARLEIYRGNRREMLVGNGIFIRDGAGQFQAVLNPNQVSPEGQDLDIRKWSEPVFTDDRAYYYMASGNRVFALTTVNSGLENARTELKIVSAVTIPAEVIDRFDSELSEIIFGSEMVFLFDGKMLIALPRTAQ